MSVRNQLTDYELGQFFCSLEDLLVLSLDANLNSSPGDLMVSKELWTFCLQNYAFPIQPKCSSFLTGSIRAKELPKPVVSELVSHQHIFGPHHTEPQEGQFTWTTLGHCANCAKKSTTKTGFSLKAVWWICKKVTCVRFDLFLYGSINICVNSMYMRAIRFIFCC